MGVMAIVISKHKVVISLDRIRHVHKDITSNNN